MCGLPTWFEAAIERDDGPSFRVTLQGRTLAYTAWNDDGEPITIQVSPPPQAWRDFLTALEALALWQWTPQYGATATPVTRWYIELAAPGRQINTAGADAFPVGDAFPGFCAALRILLGALDFR